MTEAAHPAPITVLNRDYLRIVELSTDGVSKSVKYCAAKLLQVFERLTSWKAKAFNLNLNHSWFWIPIIKRKPLSNDQLEIFEQENRQPPPQSLYDELQGEYCKDTIRKAIILLIQLGLIKRRNNPFSGQDRTHQYQADLSKLARLKATLLNASKKSSLESDPSSLKVDMSLLKRDVSLMILKIYSIALSKATSQETETGAEAPAAKSKKGSAKEACTNLPEPEAFDLFWQKYNQFCQSCGAAVGDKVSAARAWREIVTAKDFSLEHFWQGFEAFCQQIRALSKPYGIPHACRFLSGSTNHPTPYWEAALQQVSPGSKSSPSSDLSDSAVREWFDLMKQEGQVKQLEQREGVWFAGQWRSMQPVKDWIKRGWTLEYIRSRGSRR